MSNEFDQKKYFWNTDVEDNNSQILSCMFDNNQKVFFKIETGNFDNGVIGLHCLQNDPMQMTEDEKNNLWPDHIFNDFNDSKDSFTFDISPVKILVENTVEHFTEQTNKNFTFDDIKNHLNSQIKQLDPQQSVQHPPAHDRRSENFDLSLSEEDKMKMFKFSHYFIFEYQKDGGEFVDYEQFKAGEPIDHKSLESNYGASYKISGPFFEPSDVHYRVLDIEEEIEKNKFIKKNESELSLINKQTQNQQQESQQQAVQRSPVPDRQLETAQKTGYVQGVCESVLAFNNEDNRKIMTESTMVFLSKKLLSEMNVTKDAAQKFARPETFKALEQCVFSSEQNQNLEQTQTRGRGI